MHLICSSWTQKKLFWHNNIFAKNTLTIETFCKITRKKRKDNFHFNEREKLWYLWFASKLQELGYTWSFFYLGEDYFFALRVGMFDFLQRLGFFICSNDKSLTGSLLQLQAKVFSSIYCYGYFRLQPVSSTPLHFKDWDAGIRIRIRNRICFLQGLELWD